MAKTFRVALKQHIASGLSAPQAMRQAWRDVRAGLVERPPLPRRRPRAKARDNPRGAYETVRPEHVGKGSIKMFGRTWIVADHFGRLLPRDVGKRVYQTSPGVLQIENDEQFERRTGKRLNPRRNPIPGGGPMPVGRSAGRWVVQAQSPLMSAPAFYYYRTKKQAELEAAYFRSRDYRVAVRKVQRHRAKANPRAQWYWGPSETQTRVQIVFRSSRKPTRKSHGKALQYAVGPFPTADHAVSDARRTLGGRVEFKDNWPKQLHRTRAKQVSDIQGTTHAGTTEWHYLEGMRRAHEESQYPYLRPNPRRRPSRAKFCPETIEPKGRFDPRSFRTVVARKHRITIGCPKGQWDASRKRCRVGTRAQRVLHPGGEAKCPLRGTGPGGTVYLNPLDPQEQKQIRARAFADQRFGDRATDDLTTGLYYGRAGRAREIAQSYASGKNPGKMIEGSGQWAVYHWPHSRPWELRYTAARYDPTYLEFGRSSRDPVPVRRYKTIGAAKRAAGKAQREWEGTKAGHNPRKIDSQLLRWKSHIVRKLLVEGATSLSDAEIERALGGTVAAARIVPLAKMLRDKGMLKPKDIKQRRNPVRRGPRGLRIWEPGRGSQEIHSSSLARLVKDRGRFFVVHARTGEVLVGPIKHYADAIDLWHEHASMLTRSALLGNPAQRRRRNPRSYRRQVTQRYRWELHVTDRTGRKFFYGPFITRPEAEEAARKMMDLEPELRPEQFRVVMRPGVGPKLKRPPRRNPSKNPRWPTNPVLVKTIRSHVGVGREMRGMRYAGDIPHEAVGVKTPYYFGSHAVWTKKGRRYVLPEVSHKVYQVWDVTDVPLLPKRGRRNPDGVEFVTHRQWENYAKTIERKNLNKFGRSLTFSAIARRANPLIVEIRADGMFVRHGWKQAMAGATPNPGARWHEVQAGMEKERIRRAGTIGNRMLARFHEGAYDAHSKSAEVSRLMGLNPKRWGRKGFAVGDRVFMRGAGKYSSQEYPGVIRRRGAKGLYTVDYKVPGLWGEYTAIVTSRRLRPVGELPDSAYPLANPRGTVIYDRLMEIRAKKGKRGHFPGERFRHPFSSRARIYGMPDGSLRIKGPKRLWAKVPVA